MGAANRFYRMRVIEACERTAEEIEAVRRRLRNKAISQAMTPYTRFSWRKFRMVPVEPTPEEAIEALESMSAFSDLELYRLWDRSTSFLAQELQTIYKIKQAAEECSQKTNFWLTAEEFDLIAKYYKQGE